MKNWRQGRQSENQEVQFVHLLIGANSYNYETHMDTKVKVTTHDPHENKFDNEWLPVTKPTYFHIDPKEEEYLKVNT